MHETSIAKNLLEIILNKARECKATRITKITLKLGEFAGINQDSLKFAFKNITRETIAKGAILEIIQLPLLGKCRKCEEEFKINKEEFKCPKCGSLELDIISGEDLYVNNIEIE
ncbi:MAG: hydrogenase maturation nickel metallochaperone HypA [Candidatus Caldatribacteriota bacterium]|nr:hydrogenase maturation nickel metallochaperone HypA [Candidatus Caldatribacteriota bacterium]